MLIFVILVFGCLFLCWYLLLIQRRINRLVPTIPNALAISITGLFRLDLKELFKRCLYIGDYTNDNGGVTKFIYGPMVVYVVSEPEDASTVLTQCMEKMFFYKMIRPYVGEQLVAASVPVWKRNRRILDSSFKQNIIDGYIDLFNHQARRLVVAMSANVDKEFDFSHIITRNILETVCRTTMGMKVDGEDLVTDSYARAVETVLMIMANRVRNPWLIPDAVFHWSSLKKQQDEALKVIWSLSDGVLKKKKQAILNKLKNRNVTENGQKFQSCLDILLENTINPDNLSCLLTDLQLRQVVDNVMLAGFDTTAPELVFTLVCLGSYPDIQQKVYDQIIAVTGKGDTFILKEDLAKLTYLEAVIKETLRLYPAGAIVGRTSNSDVRLKNVVLPAGCQVLVHIWAVNRNKKYWGDDAAQFRPGRWEDAPPLHPAAFASFSPGRRNCIGRSYGMSLMKIVLANIIKKFKITADDKKLDIELVVLLKPTSGHFIKLELRN